MAGQIVVFEHANFAGEARFIKDQEPRLGDQNMNDKVSSFVVITGQWQFFQDPDFLFPYGPILGPGPYPWIEDIGIKNDQVSSLKSVA